MRLGDHFQQIKKKYHKTFFSGVCFDHRKIKKNYIFFAIKGNNLDGNNFIPSVINEAKDFAVIGCQYLIDKIYMPAGFFNEKQNKEFILCLPKVPD